MPQRLANQRAVEVGGLPRFTQRPSCWPGVNATKKCAASRDFLDASCGLKSDQRGRLLVERVAAVKSVR
jgi:hypothetical protein